MARSERQKAYNKYLKTVHWQSIREAAIQRDQKKCTKCESPFFLHVHHIVYKDNWFDTELKDVVTLCYKCHAEVHNVTPQKPKRNIPKLSKKQKQKNYERVHEEIFGKKPEHKKKKRKIRKSKVVEIQNPQNFDWSRHQKNLKQVLIHIASVVKITEEYVITKRPLSKQDRKEFEESLKKIDKYIRKGYVPYDLKRRYNQVKNQYFNQKKFLFKIT